MFSSPDLVMTRLQGRSRHHRVPCGLPPLLTERWPRATGLTSYLSGCFGFLQLGDPVFRTAQAGGFANFAEFAHSPTFCSIFAPRVFRMGLLARSPRLDQKSVLVYSSNRNPLGNCINLRVATSQQTLLSSTRLLIASRLAVPSVRVF